MKRTLLTFFLAVGTMLAHADRIDISSATLNPGGTSVQVTVSLEGTRFYTSYNMDITLPEGWSVEYRNNAPRVTMVKTGGIYPSTYDEDEDAYSYTHTVSCSYGEIGERVLRVACISTSNETFIANSGALFRVYLQASPYAKPGNPDIHISGIACATYDSGTGVVTGYNFEDAVSNAVTVSNAATVPLNISSALWSTCILPFDADIPDGITAYKTNRVEDGSIYLSKAATFEAYTPYILHSSAAYSGTINGTIDVSNYPEVGYVSDDAGLLQGAIIPQSITSGYVLQKAPETETPKFYNVNGQTFFIPEGRCWLTLPAEANAPSIRLIIEETSAINMVDAAQDGLIYNILGQPVSQPIPGQVYIQNGTKYIHQ